MRAYAPSSLDAACEALVQRIPHLARHRWWCDGEPCDRDIYEDAAFEALARCLARWDSTRGPFLPYALRRILGALRYAVIQYRNWRHGMHLGGDTRPGAQAALLRPVDHAEAVLHHLDLAQRLQALPPRLQGIARALLDGMSLTAYAEAQGTTPGAVRMRCLRWRQAHDEVA
jgi:hypothetical protein